MESIFKCNTASYVGYCVSFIWFKNGPLYVRTNCTIFAALKEIVITLIIKKMLLIPGA
jgi:hypothetical protein